MSGCLQVTTHFSKTTSKQSRTGKSDVIDVLYCIYSALKQLHKGVCLGGNVILRWPSTSAFRPLKHTHLLKCCSVKKKTVCLHEKSEVDGLSGGWMH